MVAASTGTRTTIRSGRSWLDGCAALESWPWTADVSWRAGSGALGAQPAFMGPRQRTASLSTARASGSGAADRAFGPLASTAVRGRGCDACSAAKPKEPVRIAGMVVRTGAGDGQPDRFSALSVRCPHEHCDVDYPAETSRLPQDVVQEIGRAVQGSALLVPVSQQRVQGRERRMLAGPAPRGLYRFRVTAVSGTAVEIAEVEEDLLIFI